MFAFASILKDYPEVCHNVDVEGLGDLLFGLLQQRVRWHDSSVVNQDRYNDNLLFDLRDNLNDLLPVGHITAKDRKEERNLDSLDLKPEMARKYLTQIQTPFLQVA